MGVGIVPNIVFVEDECSETVGNSIVYLGICCFGIWFLLAKPLHEYFFIVSRKGGILRYIHYFVYLFGRVSFDDVYFKGHL